MRLKLIMTTSDLRALRSAGCGFVLYSQPKSPATLKASPSSMLEDLIARNESLNSIPRQEVVTDRSSAILSRPLSAAELERGDDNMRPHSATLEQLYSMNAPNEVRGTSGVMDTSFATKRAPPRASKPAARPKQTATKGSKVAAALLKQRLASHGIPSRR
jgi:hypothetical protein